MEIYFRTANDAEIRDFDFRDSLPVELVQVLEETGDKCEEAPKTRTLVSYGSC